MNIMHQAEAFASEKSSQPMLTLIDKLSAATLFTSVSTVLEAFQKAKERMQRVTEGYEKNVLTPDVQDDGNT